MDIFAIRRKRLRQLLEQDFDGSQTDLANCIVRQPDYISRLLSNGKARKNLGEALARWIEDKTNKPRGWLDQDDTTSPDEPQADEIGWPFKFSPKRWLQVPATERRKIEGVVEGLVRAYEASHPSPSPKSHVARKAGGQHRASG